MNILPFYVAFKESKRIVGHSKITELIEGEKCFGSCPRLAGYQYPFLSRQFRSFQFISKDKFDISFEDPLHKDNLNKTVEQKEQKVRL